MEKENERLRDQTGVLNSILVPNLVENCSSGFNQPSSVIHSDGFNRSGRQDDEKNKEQTSSEENTENELVGRRKPRSFFNFNSFRKPKQKDRVPNMGKTETETS